ncbi:enhanced serine sensitivity protein SseB [Vagococcus entomophilus]|uniref:Enhanced serine sensitivity protein SseB n=1 Tax=Vagococcus entomophilus TaxID=1160095 RepID=A0A430AKE0_9ENTE|nr:enhanced serine sensitivity protein SseB [Vagococcus entomophilus]RSU08555.1 enhanced serine sensitivity protein SseB [Vagococcus entomophilus]
MNKQNIVENPKLCEMMKLLRKEYTKKIENKFYEQLWKSKFLLPAIVKEENKISIIKILDKQENEYLPIFTDWQNFQLNSDNTKESQSTIFTFEECFNIVQSDSSIFGIVINPYSDNLVLTRENLQFLEKSQTTIKKGEKISIGMPKDYPYQLVEACKNFFEEGTSVKSAFLLQMVKANQISLLLVIETKDEETILPKISKCVEKFLKSDDVLDIISLNTSLGQNVTKGYEPFFKRK